MLRGLQTVVVLGEVEVCVEVPVPIIAPLCDVNFLITGSQEDVFEKLGHRVRRELN